MPSATRRSPTSPWTPGPGVREPAGTGYADRRRYHRSTGAHLQNGPFGAAVADERLEASPHLMGVQGARFPSLFVTFDRP
jgi:hypothetical protein